MFKEIIKKEIKKLEKRKEILKNKEEYYYQFKKVNRQEINFELERIDWKIKKLKSYLQDNILNDFIKNTIIYHLEKEIYRLQKRIHPGGRIEINNKNKNLIEKRNNLIKLLKELKNK